MIAPGIDDEAIFHAAREIADPGRRREYVREACAGDESLIAHVAALLAAADSPDSLLDRSPTTDPVPAIDHPLLDRPGTVIGPYKTLEQIGEGGFGVVFLAEQAEPVRRKVALKILKAGMDSRQVVARFEAERQALAMMDHPNIAKVFDGGVSGSGRPYFVMELVRGIPITDFCDRNHLSVRQRLELFIPVCQAVQHAHQKGVIHRDIKPSNVLVTLHDGVPVPKVIDFGIAKATGQRLTERTLFTNFAQMVGTPLYMSPEQAEMSGLDVDTRTDVYGLGVLLYELLTGTTPFDRERFKEAGYEEIRRIIRDEEPARPSTRLSTLGPAAATIFASRRTDAHGLRRTFRRELDWMVMKCLEKDRNRRYESAGALAADVQRYLRDEPVQACPPSAAYRVRKLARRNRRVLVMVSVLALATLIGVGALAVSTVLVWKANKDLKEAVERERREVYFQRITVAHREFLAGNLVVALRALGDCPEDLRGWEWHYLMRLSKVEPLIILNDSGVHGVAFSPDGEAIAAACGDGSVKVLNGKTGKVIRKIEAHADSAASVAFNPDGSHLASAGSDGLVKVWDLGTGREDFIGKCDALRKFGAAYSVAFSPPDGRHLAAGSGGVVRVWDWKASRLVHSFPGHENHSIPLVFSPNGRQLATGGVFREGQKLWDVEAGGSPLRVFPAHGHPVSALAFSPNGGLLASASFDKNVKLWDTTTGHLRHTCSHTDLVLGAVFSPDGRRLASASTDRTVRIWDAATGREVLGLRGHDDLCGCVAFSPDPNGWRLASASTDGTIRIWDATPLRGDEGEEVLTFSGHREEIRCVAVSPDGRMAASAGFGSQVKVWDSATGRVAFEFSHGGQIVFAVAWHPDGRRIVTSGGEAPLHTVKVWDAQTGQQVLELQTGPDGLTGAYHGVSFTPDGSYLVTGKINGAVQVWDAGTGQKIGLLGTHDREIRAVGFSGVGHLVTASGDGEVKLWDVARLDKAFLDTKPKPRHILRARVPGASVNVAFSADGTRLATGGEENTVKIWDVETGRLLQSLPGHRGEVYAVAFSRDGRWLASASGDGTVRVWDCRRDYAIVRSLPGHTDLVNSLAFSPDSRRLYSGSCDSKVKVWDTTKLQEESNR